MDLGEIQRERKRETGTDRLSERKNRKAERSRWSRRKSKLLRKMALKEVGYVSCLTKKVPSKEQCLKRAEIHSDETVNISEKGR